MGKRSRHAAAVVRQQSTKGRLYSEPEWVEHSEVLARQAATVPAVGSEAVGRSEQAVRARLLRVHAARLRAEADEAEVVAYARERGWSWADIARDLEVPVATLHRRYRVACDSA